MENTNVLNLLEISRKEKLLFVFDKIPWKNVWIKKMSFEEYKVKIYEYVGFFFQSKDFFFAMNAIKKDNIKNKRKTKKWFLWCYNSSFMFYSCFLGFFFVIDPYINIIELQTHNIDKVSFVFTITWLIRLLLSY